MQTKLTLSVDYLKSHIHSKLLSTVHHADYLSGADLLTVPVAADIVKTFYVRLGEDVLRDAPFSDEPHYLDITPHIAAHVLKMSVAELDAAARSNQSGHHMVASLQSLLMDHNVAAQTEGVPMLCVSNRESYLGAVEVLSEDVQTIIRERLHTDDFLVLPSSIHEMIVVPASIGTPHDLAYMVQEINTSLNPCDVLSNHVFCIKDGTLTAAV